MTETNTPTNEESIAPPMSLGGRLTNIFVSPGEVFDDVKIRPPQPASWIVPASLSIIVGIIFTMVIFSQGQILQNLREAQEKQMQEMVDKGKLTRQQADNALAMGQRFSSPSVLKVVGGLSTIFMVGLKVFFITLLLWAIGHLVFKSDFEFGKALEVVGLSCMISVLDVIVRMLLVLIFSNLYMNLGPVLFIQHYNPQNKVHMVLGWLDAFMFWQVAVWAIGLARLSGKSFLKCFLWVFGTLFVILGSLTAVLIWLSNMLMSLGGK